MFKDSGKKIMALSKVICWIGIVAFTIIAIQSFVNLSKGNIGNVTAYYTIPGAYKWEEVEFFERGFLSLLGAFLSYYCSLFIHGFGELVDHFCGNNKMNESEIINSTEMEELKSLKDRLDRGEISKEEYNEKRSLIMRK